MSQISGEEKAYTQTGLPLGQIELNNIAKHIEIVVSVFALHSGYLSEQQAFEKVQRIINEYILQGRSYPLTHSGFKRQIHQAIRKKWLERNGNLLRITPQGLKAFYI